MLNGSTAQFGSELMGGMIAVGVGGAVLAEFGSVAAAIATIAGTTLAAPLTLLVAVLLILWGISKAYPALRSGSRLMHD